MHKIHLFTLSTTVTYLTFCVSYINYTSSVNCIGFPMVITAQVTNFVGRVFRQSFIAQNVKFGVHKARLHIVL